MAFFFHKAIIEGGNWSLLTPSSHALYPVLRTFAFWDYYEYACREDRDSQLDDIIQFQRIIKDVFVPENVGKFAVNLVRNTRPNESDSPDFIKKWISWGAGLRASQYLLLGGKVRAVFHGRFNVSIEDIKKLAYPVLRHRIIPNFYAESEKVDSEKIIEMLLDIVKEPVSGL